MSDMEDRPLNLIIAGVGGQGVLLASRLLCDAAVKAGLKVQAMEEHGMAQRGGAVTTQLRLWADEIHTAQIRPGTGDILLAFEPMEGIRALPFIAPDAVLLVNTRQLPPPGRPGKTKDRAAGMTTSLDMEEVERLLRQGYPRVHLFDATALAEEAGSGLAVNMVLIGAMAALDLLPGSLGAEALKEAIKEAVRPSMAKVNLRAFEAGWEAVGEV